MEEDEKSALAFYLDLIDEDVTKSCDSVSPDEMVRPFKLSDSSDISREVGPPLNSHLQCNVLRTDVNAVLRFPSPASIHAKPTECALTNCIISDDTNLDTDKYKCSRTEGGIDESNLINSERYQSLASVSVGSESSIDSDNISEVVSPCHLKTFKRILQVPCLQSLNSLLQSVNVNFEEDSVKWNESEGIGVFLQKLVVPCLENLNTLLQRYKSKYGENCTRCDGIEEMDNCGEVLKLSCLQSVNCMLQDCKDKYEEIQVKCSDSEEVGLLIKDLEVPCLESLNSLLKKYNLNSKNDSVHCDNTKETEAVNRILKIPCFESFNSLLPYCRVKLEDIDENKLFIKDCEVPCLESLYSLLQRYKTELDNHPAICDNTVKFEAFNYKLQIPCLQSLNHLLENFKIKLKKDQIKHEDGEEDGFFNNVLQVPYLESTNSLLEECETKFKNDLERCDDSATMNVFSKIFQVPCLQSMDSLLEKCKIENVICDHEEEKDANKAFTDPYFESLKSLIQNCNAKSEIDHVSYDDNRNTDAIKKKLAVPCLQSLDSLQQSYEIKLENSHDECDTSDRSEEKHLSGGFKKTVKDSCLLNFENILQEYVAKGFEFKTPSFSSLRYEVDVILAHKNYNGEKYYYVKWKNYSSEYNTWVLSRHVNHCQDIINYYEALKNPQTKINQELLKYFIQDLISRKPLDILTLIKVCALVLIMSWEEVNQLNLTVPQLCETAQDIKNISFQEVNDLEEKLLNIMIFNEKRKALLIDLMEWQNEINSGIKGGFIEVENNVDLEEPPRNYFLFINDYVYDTADIYGEPIVFCKCSNCYEEKKSCCPSHSDQHFAYNKDRLLILKPGFPIYECNNRCSCDINCINRVVQWGPKVALKIFRTSNDCGWGLKTLEDIEKGQFVIEYLGEIITSTEAEARGNAYNYEECSYLFDLEYGVDNIPYYTVDAFHMGNASHFINHSCDPNLIVFAVWINQQDPRMPRLAMFAKRKIGKGEELTFDYQMVKKSQHSQKNSKRVKRNEVLCKCKSKNCKKYLF